MNPFQKNESKETLFSPVSTEEMLPRPPSPPKKSPPVSPEVQFVSDCNRVTAYVSLPKFLLGCCNFALNCVRAEKLLSRGIRIHLKIYSRFFCFGKEATGWVSRIFFFQLGPRVLLYFTAYSLGEKKHFECPGRLGKHSCLENCV